MISKSFIKVSSSWNVETYNQYYVHSNKTDSIVILFPGSDYSCDKPLLYYARKIALQCNCNVLSLEYGYSKVNERYNDKFIYRLKEECLSVIKKCLDSCYYDNVYFIGKSVGSLLAGEISKDIGYHKVNNLFLTPIDATVSHAELCKCTVITGTKDEFLSSDSLNRLKHLQLIDLHIIEGATHSLEISDDYSKSLKVLCNITNIYKDFIEQNH